MGHQDQQDQHTYIPKGGTVLNLAAANEVPHAGHPVGQQGKRGHEQREHDGAVLRVAIQLLQEAQQAQQTYGLQQVDTEVLKGERGTERERELLISGRNVVERRPPAFFTVHSDHLSIVGLISILTQAAAPSHIQLAASPSKGSEGTR